jgi:hypothetical protein
MLTGLDCQSDGGRKILEMKENMLPLYMREIHVFLKHPRIRIGSGSGEPAHARSARALGMRFGHGECSTGAPAPCRRSTGPKRSVLVYIYGKPKTPFCYIETLLNGLD